MQSLVPGVCANVPTPRFKGREYLSQLHAQYQTTPMVTTLSPADWGVMSTYNTGGELPLPLHHPKSSLVGKVRGHFYPDQTAG